MDRKGKKEKREKKAAATSLKGVEENPEFETQSQQQNRHGRGRQQNGTEGGRQVRGSNH